MDNKQNPIFMPFEMQNESLNDINEDILMSPTNHLNFNMNEEPTFFPSEIQKDVLDDVNKDAFEIINENVNQQQKELPAQEINAEKQHIQELNVENECTLEDELEEMYMSRLRECDTETLKHILRTETEMLARLKAKEEVLMNSVKCQKQELTERQVHLDKEISYLVEMKEKLHHQLEQEQLNRQQLVTEMNNTGKIVQILTENYNSLEEAHNVMFQEIQKLKQNQNEQFDSYNAEKSKLSNSIERENKELMEIQSNWEKESLGYNIELERKINTLKELTEKEEALAREVAHKTEINQELQNNFDENEKELVELQDKEQTLLNDIDNVDRKIEELKKQQKEKDVKYEEILEAKKNDLTQSVERLRNAEEQKTITAKELEDEVELTKKLEVIYAQLEEKRLSLLGRKEDIERSINVVNEDRKSHINSLECAIQKLDDDMAVIEKEITNIMKDKNEKLEDLQLKQQLYENETVKLTDLENSSEKLQSEIDINSHKCTESENKMISFLVELKDLKTMLSNEQERCDFLAKERDEQLQKLNEILNHKQSELDKLQEETSSTNKDLQTELIAYKDKIEKLLKENGDKNNQELEQLETNLKKLANELMTEESNLKKLRMLIEEGKAERAKLEITLELTKIDTDESILIEEPQDMKPTGILKSPGKRTSPKSVSWRVPSTSTIDSEPLIDNVKQNKKSTSTLYFNEDKTNSKDELFDELMKMSSPKDATKVIPKKRSRSE